MTKLLIRASMIELLRRGALSDTHSKLSWFGGQPLAPPGTAWPTCAECTQPMQFLAQLRIDEDIFARPGLLLLFMCEAEAGCQTFAPASGANTALFVPASMPITILESPADAKPLGFSCTVLIQSYTEGVGYYAARMEWGKTNASSRDVMGQMGGEPDWIQASEIPDCICGNPMKFVAQIEEGPSEGGINFGGGSAYAFLCDHCESQARFLWQC